MHSKLSALISHSDRDIGKETSGQEAAKGWEEQRVFREWFNETIMSSDANRLSNAVMIVPYGSALPNYRDEPNG